MICRVAWYLAILLGISACAVNPAERNSAGNGLYDQGAFDEALRAYQAAQVTSPDSPEPYFNAANAFAQIGKLSDALAALNQALETADEALTAKAYYNLGNIYFAMGLYEQAVESYRQTLFRDPNDNDARYNLELALNRSSPPSATPLAQAQEPESQSTPTNLPGDQPTQTPTPSPQDVASTPQATMDASSESTMTVDEAGRLLDSIQQDQGTLRDNLVTPSAVEAQPEKDW